MKLSSACGEIVTATIAPITGARIETSKDVSGAHSSPIAPITGARIET